MLKLGNKSISNLFIGQKAAMKAFLGQKLVWQKATGLPYDAEVEYLESTGTQYIDTGVVANGEFDAEYMIETSSSIRNFIVAGARSPEQHLNFGQFENSGRVYLAYLGTYWEVFASTAKPNTVYHARVHFTDGLQSINVNGTDGIVKNFSGTEAVGRTIYLFKRNIYEGITDTLLPMIGRMYSFKIWQNSILVRDMIPVRVGGVGYMYDRVSKQLFGNQGTGNFIVGPDVVEVEYLESTGTQWIDLGLNSTTDKFCDFEIRFQKTTSSSDTPFGYQYGATARYGMWPGYVGVDATRSVGFDLIGDYNWHTVKMENGIAVTIDGVSTPIGTGTVRGNIGLVAFGRVTSATLATSYVLTTARISMLKIYNTDGVLVRDFVPVRVGMEGAMMDRLTRKIYRNQGTGAFKFGADRKETPLMCNSYVKDGLIAMWDGTENAGWGTHDANATTWKDLTGNRNLTISGDTTKAFFKPNALHRTTELGDLATDYFITYPCTISITMRVDDGIAASANPRFFSCTKAGDLSVRREFDCYNQTPTYAPRLYPPLRFGYFGRSSTGLWAINCICLDSTNVKFIDSICEKYVETALNEKPAPFMLNIGAWNSTSSAMLGDYYCIRIYSRALTAEEIAWNYEIDKRRFNLT